MATISAANVQTLADSLAKHIIDLSALVGSTSAVQTGQATTLGHIAGLNDPAQEYALLDAFESFAAAENAWLSQETSYNAILDLCLAACAALDQATGGLPAFLAANGLQVDPHFLDAFNRAAGKAMLYPAKALSAYQAFGPVVSSLGVFTATGAGAGSFAAGSSVPATYGNAPLQLYNAGAGPTGAASGTYTVTYSAYNASGVLQTGLTATGTLAAGTAAGAGVSLGVSGVAVTGIALSGGTSGDKAAVKTTLLRSVAY